MRRPSLRPGRRGSEALPPAERVVATAVHAAVPELALNVRPYDLETGEAIVHVSQAAAPLRSPPGPSPAVAPPQAQPRRPSQARPLQQQKPRDLPVGRGRAPSQTGPPSAGRRPSLQQAKARRGSARPKGAVVRKSKAAPPPPRGASPADAPRQETAQKEVVQPQQPRSANASASQPEPREMPLLTDEETMMLCGVHPGTAAADWFLELRARSYTCRPGDAAASLGVPSRCLSYPPPSPSTGEPLSRLAPRLGSKEPTPPPARPLQIPAEKIATPLGPHPAEKAQPTPVPVSPSGLTRHSSDGTEKVTVSSLAASSSGTETDDADASETSTGSADDEGTLRRHNLMTVDRDLISHFDQLQEQRRLLSMKDAKGNSSLAMDPHRSLDTDTHSPRPVMETVAYDHPPALSSASQTSVGGAYDDDRVLSPRVVVLSLGPISPLFRADYGFYLQSLLPQPSSTAGGGQRHAWADKALPPSAQEDVMVLTDAYGELGLRPTVPPPQLRQRRSGAELPARRHSRAVDTIGGRLGGLSPKKKAHVPGGRLPPLARQH